MLFVLFVTFRILVIVSLELQDRKRGTSENDTRNTNIPARKMALPQLTSDTTRSGHQ
jgi:hypothetical protein